MRIIDLRATTVTVPIEAPLRHANGCHWGRFVRTIVEVETDEGLVGLGEMGGGGESAEAAFHALKTYLIGHDPMRLEELRFLISNPTALGQSFIPQHSDARVLEQLIYKWKHARKEIAAVLCHSYEQLLQSGRAVTVEEISRDVTRMFSANFHAWIGQ
jgi:hypothetical protein